MRILLFLLMLCWCSPAMAAPEPLILNGYGARVDGVVLAYRTPVIGDGEALLVRSNAEAPAITWDTEPVPAGAAGRDVTFVMVAGTDVKENETRQFRLFIDGRPLFTVSNAMPADHRWTMRHASGATLAFEGRGADGHGDYYGHLLLTLPARMVRPGAPVRLRLEGEQGGSPVWFMIFRHQYRPSVALAPRPAVRREAGGERQLLNLDVVHLGAPRRAELWVDGRKSRDVNLQTGANTYEVTVAPVKAPTTMAYEVRAGRDVVGRGDVRLAPVRDWTVYLLPHSHVDIGYTELQTEVEHKQWRNLDEALAIIERTASYPEGARFKWNAEVLWAVDSYLRQAPPDRREAFLQAVRRGDIALQALYGNHLTGLSSGEELLQLTAFARRFGRDYGVEIPTAMISDVPGYAWGLVPALAQSGVRYFSSGPNYMSWLPHRGDRVGYTHEAWGDRPFYWVSPSGQEKILTWLAGRGYSFFHESNGGNLVPGPASPILSYLSALEASDYPYDLVQMRYAVGGDNGPPDPRMSDLVRQWNETYRTPRLVIATTDELFAAFEARYADRLPTAAGDFTPYWEDGAASTARETAIARNAADRLVQAATLWALRSREAVPRDRFRTAWRDVLLFNEHTWGAHNSISAPDDSFAIGQWNIKKQFALDADRAATELLAGAVDVGHAPTGAAVAALDVWNTTSWPRSELVRIPADTRTRGDRVRDDRGRPLPSQRLSTGELAVLVADVPPLGARRLFFEPGTPHGGGTATAAANGLRNEHLSLTLDDATGAIRSLVWRGRELVDAGKPYGLNALFYVPGTDTAAAQTSRALRVRVGEAGPLVASIIVEAEAPGSNALTRELVLVAGADHVLLTNTLDRKPVREKEGVHFGFPFRVEQPQVRLDLAWAIARPEADQIAGACKNHLSVQRWVDVSNQEHGVTLATPDAPLVELGGLTAEVWNRHKHRPWLRYLAPTAAVYSYVMNNYWHTNYKADQPGLTTFRYALRPHGTFDAVAAHHFGQGIGMPLVVAPADASRPVAPSLFEVDDPSVVVSALHVADDGQALVARLYNVTNAPVEARLRFAEGLAARVYASDLSEVRGQTLEGAFALPPHGFTTVRLEFAR